MTTLRPLIGVVLAALLAGCAQRQPGPMGATVHGQAEARFNAITAGMSEADVLSQIGRPTTVWALPRQRQMVWSYRYDSPFCQWFMVGMGPEGRVVDTSYGPDPWCEEDGFFNRFRLGR